MWQQIALHCISSIHLPSPPWQLKTVLYRLHTYVSCSSTVKQKIIFKVYWFYLYAWPNAHIAIAQYTFSRTWLSLDFWASDVLVCCGNRPMLPLWYLRIWHLTIKYQKHIRVILSNYIIILQFIVDYKGNGYETYCSEPYERFWRWSGLGPARWAYFHIQDYLAFIWIGLITFMRKLIL